MKKAMKKLQLSRETLTQLEERHLSPVAGGVVLAEADSGQPSCANTCSWQYCPTGGGPTQ